MNVINKPETVFGLFLMLCASVLVYELAVAMTLVNKLGGI